MQAEKAKSRKRPVNGLREGGCDSGGHVFSHLLMSGDIISIKLQLTGKSRLIFQFCHMRQKETSFSLKLHGFYASLSSWSGVGSDSSRGCIEVPLQQHLLIR